ncbi:MAG TPA: alanine racemase [Steroidobacteraceae bacterium]|nr:alanine racemase [Steroidobacteraceae bacterium]
MSRLIRAVIDTDALRSNLRVLRRFAPAARVVAVVKANAYGHGLTQTALALNEADAFGVARLDEGIQLRTAGIVQPIVLLEGVFAREELAEAAHHGLDLVVHDARQIELLEESRAAHQFVLWLKIDTGMNRLGFRSEDFPAALERLQRLPRLPREIRLLTHLARADELEDGATAAQVARFKALTRGMTFATSMGNSAGILGWPDAHGDWIRPGIALYGVSPFAQDSGARFSLQPVMTLETTVLATRRVARGEGVGYGAAWRAERDTTIAILAGGYGDCLPRSLANGAPVLIDGRRAALVGHVSMDMIAVNIDEVADVHVGSRGVLWGAGLRVEEVSVHAGTIPYELLCGVRQRVPREFR